MPRTPPSQTHWRVPSPGVTASHSTTTPSSSTMQLLSSSPTTSSPTHATTSSRPFNHVFSPPPTTSSAFPASSRRSSSSIAPIPEDAVLLDPPRFVRADDRRIFDLQSDLKSTLTDLLNCDTVRHDDDMRAWVQSRLMDAEHELKRHRKRRVSRSASLSSESSSGSRDEPDDPRRYYARATK